MKKRIKKPIQGCFFYYCYDCKYWESEKTVGCGNLGTCNAILGAPD